MIIYFKVNHIGEPDSKAWKEYMKGLLFKDPKTQVKELIKKYNEREKRRYGKRARLRKFVKIIDEEEYECVE